MTPDQSADLLMYAREIALALWVIAVGVWVAAIFYGAVEGIRLAERTAARRGFWTRHAATKSPNVGLFTPGGL